MNTPLPVLNKELLTQKLLGTKLADFAPELLDYPERVIQFGEGNFLRAFVEWLIHHTNQAGYFKGRVVVVQPIPQGRVANLNVQDGLYTLLLRGLQNGKVIENREIIPAISRGLNPYDNWQEVLKCAENPAIDIVISNTTEAGIVFNPKDQLTDNPPESFPGKLAVYLYHRYQYFKGDPDKGMLIIPCELIDRNGDNLKQVILKLAESWRLPQGFIDWINNSNHFLNSLVDRIVTGYPMKEVGQLEAELGYHDDNLNTGEIFHLWVIEGDQKLAERFPLHQAGLNVKWVSDMAPYRTRKVRILNGAHTSSVAVAYLSNIDLVREAVHDKTVGKFMQEVVFQEIIPTLDLDQTELQSFAKDVIERFDNPFIEHKWSDISLNSTSKFTARVLPSLQRYIEKKGAVPPRLTFALASLIALYHGTEIRGGKLVGHRCGQEYLIQDDLETLIFYRDIWVAYHDGRIRLEELVEQVINKFWPVEIKKLSGLKAGVALYLKIILEHGMSQSFKKNLVSF